MNDIELKQFLIKTFKKKFKTINWHYMNRYIDQIILRKYNLKILHKTDLHHILPRSIFPEYIDEKFNHINLTKREHFLAHFLLCKALPKCVQMIQAFHYMAGTIEIKNINSRMYQKIQEAQARVASKQMRKNMKGKSTYIDKDGNKYHVNKNDPIVKDLELVHQYTGTCNVTNGIISCKMNISDPRITSGEYYSVAKGRTYTENQLKKRKLYCILQHKETGLYKQILVSDRHLYPDYQGYLTSHTLAYNEEGILVRVHLDNFKNGKFIHYNKNRVDIIDLNGKVTKVSKDDPRFLTGEIKIHKSEKSRKKSSENMLAYNKACLGSKWMTNLELNREKNWPTEVIEQKKLEGWVMGRYLRKEQYRLRKESKPQKFKRCMVNNGVLSKKIPHEELKRHLHEGWIKGMIKKSQPSVD